MVSVNHTIIYLISPATTVPGTLQYCSTVPYVQRYASSFVHAFVSLVLLVKGVLMAVIHSFCAARTQKKKY